MLPICIGSFVVRNERRLPRGMRAEYLTPHDRYVAACRLFVVLAHMCEVRPFIGWGEEQASRHAVGGDGGRQLQLLTVPKSGCRSLSR